MVLCLRKYQKKPKKSMKGGEGEGDLNRARYVID